MDKIKRIGYRPTWAEVNLVHLAHNFNQVRKICLPHARIMVCVKADAYGHGLIPVAKRLQACGVDYLSVASIDEGIRLRKSGIRVPILVLGMILKRDVAPLFRYGLSQTICSEELAIALSRFAQRQGRTATVHIKADTGMGRLGVLHTDALAFVHRIAKMKCIAIEGVFTHLACADTNRDFTLQQIDTFARLIRRLNKSGIHIPLVHAANSMGVVDYRKSHFNMVRPGLIIYGIYPKEGLKVRLRPVLNLKTRVIYTKRVPGRYGISYGHTYVTKRRTTIAILPIGYGDGYPRNLSNCAPVLIRGKRFTISGRVCMDQIMVDVGNSKVAVGDEAVLIGGRGKDKITAEELAGFADTIPYEIVCGLGSRVPRIYV